MPDDRQGSRQVSPWLLPGQQLDPGSDRHRYAYDTSAVVHSRSPSRSTPDASSAPFPWCSSPRLIHRSNPRWFTASPCRAAVEGPPPSPAQHRNHQRDLLHRNLQLRSWRTIIGEPHDDHVVEPHSGCPRTEGSSSLTLRTTCVPFDGSSASSPRRRSGRALIGGLVRPVVVCRSKGAGLVGKVVTAHGESWRCATPTDLCRQRVW